MLGSLASVVLAMAITLSVLGVTSLLDVAPIVSSLVIPIINSTLALFLTVAAVRGNSWPIFITYPLPVLALLHLNAFDLVGFATVLINIGLAGLAFFLIRKCVRVGQTQLATLSQSDRSD